jgi:putative membrane protein
LIVAYVGTPVGLSAVSTNRTQAISLSVGFYFITDILWVFGDGTFAVRYVFEELLSLSFPETVYQFVYLPTLAIHILLAVVSIPFVYYVLLLAVAHPVSELRSTRHPTVGRVAAALWVTSFVLGNAVYLLLYVVYG